MIKRLLTLSAGILAFVAAFAQTKYEPQILILSPYEVTYDKVFENEISDYNEKIKKAQTQGITSRLTDDTAGQPENIKMMVAHELAYARTMDFTKGASYLSQQHLSYIFFEKFPNLLILLKDIKCSGEFSELGKIARKEKLQYILNFPKIHFYREAGVSKASIRVQFYDHSTKALLLNQDFTGDWRNPGGEFTCRDSSLHCTVSNAMSGALWKIGEIVIESSPTLRKEEELEEQREEAAEQLSQKRFNELRKNYYPKPWDSAFISKISSAAGSKHVSYRGLVDDTKTKFIAFYFERTSPNDFPQFKNDLPPAYGYMLKGAQYKGKWYYKRSDTSFVHTHDIEEGRSIHYSASLREWGFFREGTIEPTPDFWETHQFEKIKDATKDPGWEKHKAMWEEAEERENRDYVGMYAFVAEDIKKLRQAENKLFDSLTGSDVFIPFYEAQIKTNPAHFSEYFLWGKKPTLIFPKDRKYALNPIAITDSTGQKTLHFYFAFAGSKTVYEWTYLKPVPIRRYSGEIIDQLGTVTKWNFYFTTLDDDVFWEKYVLAKSGTTYKYLKRLN